MSDVIHVTENSGQAVARVSAVTLSQLSALIGTTLPTVDPVVAGALWNDSGIVKISAG